MEHETADADVMDKITPNNVDENKKQCNVDKNILGDIIKTLNCSSPRSQNIKDAVSLNTPTKTMKRKADPMTPTTNLKMLMEVTLEENKEIKRVKEKSVSCVVDENKENLHSGENVKPISRKSKSLGLLCRRFLSKYPEYPKANDCIEISLDEIAKELSVERRRIYDIVNVLNSVEIVQRIAKNRYKWNGKVNLPGTLAKLRATAEMEKICEHIRNMKDFEISQHLEDFSFTESPIVNGTESSKKCQEANNNDLKNNVSVLRENVNGFDSRREKSLGVMSQRFLMLFLVTKGKSLNLEFAAKILIGDASMSNTENSKFKTKIRRLYDIANILTSLSLIEKVRVLEMRGKKPAFHYIGPDLDQVNIKDNKENLSPSESLKRTGSPIPSRPHGKRRKLYRAKSENLPSKTKKTKNKKFTRNKSLQDMCEFAELERQRLFATQKIETTETVKPITTVVFIRGNQPIQLNSITRCGILSLPASDRNRSCEIVTIDNNVFNNSLAISNGTLSIRKHDAQIAQVVVVSSSSDPTFRNITPKC